MKKILTNEENKLLNIFNILKNYNKLNQDNYEDFYLFKFISDEDYYKILNNIKSIIIYKNETYVEALYIYESHSLTFDRRNTHYKRNRLHEFLFSNDWLEKYNQNEKSYIKLCLKIFKNITDYEIIKKTTEEQKLIRLQKADQKNSDLFEKDYNYLCINKFFYDNAIVNYEKIIIKEDLNKSKIKKEYQLKKIIRI